MLILMPTKKAEDWRSGLADPRKQWKAGRSAKLMADTWERHRPALPPEISRVLSGSPVSGLTPLLAMPEYQVPLPGGTTSSQNDVFLLGAVDDGSAVIMVEGKVDEPFGDTMTEWLKEGSKGKRERLNYFTDRLGLAGDPPDDIRYQLLHRTASAIIEAKRFHARYAVMLVHSFSPAHAWFDDYAAFVKLLGGTPENGGVGMIPGHAEPELWIGWAHGLDR